MTARSLITAFVLALAAAPASAQISDDHKLVAAFKSIVAKANDSTVRIRAGDGDVSLGTVVFSDGYILTKASEVRGEPIYVRFADGTEYEAEVVGRHRATDLAMLRVDAKGLKPITFADSKKLAVGSWLAAAAPTTEDVRVGVLSAPVRELKPDPFSDEAIIVNHNRGFMGVRLDLTDPTDKEGHTTGAKVTTVDKDTPAAKAGIKEKDLIVAVDSTRVVGRTSLQETLENFRPGDAVTLTLERDGEVQKLKVKLGAAPVDKNDRSRIQNAMGGDLSGRRTGFPAVIMTDMVVEPKNCGGPVVDLDGNVLGINIARAGRVETWILPSEKIRPLLEDLKSGKYAPGHVVKSDK